MQQLKTNLLCRHRSNARERGEYTKAELADLVSSIQEHGLLQPLVVTPDGDHYTILAGHRRHAALVSLGIKEAPCIVLDANEQQSLAVLLGENASHRPVDPLREASAVAKLVQGLSEEKHPYDRAAALLGKSVNWVRGRMRLTALSDGWRKAHADPDSPIHEWPVGHLELVAALPDAVQQDLLEEWTVFNEGVPLLVELKRSLARSTCDLRKVPWDPDAADLVEGAPACSACPSRASAQGVLFADDSKGDRCLNAACFKAKQRAAVASRILQVREKYGEALRVESAFGLEDIPVPEGIQVHREFELLPKAKSKGGFPVLRLRTLEIAYMAVAQAAAKSGAAASKEKRTGPRSMDEKRADLDKRRQIRAIELFRGSMLGIKVDIGTEKHPEEVSPPEPKVPELLDLVALVLVYGTGFPVGDGPRIPDRPDAEALAAALANARKASPKNELATRSALWARVREPIARSLRIVGTMKAEFAADLASQAGTVCSLCGLDWQRGFMEPATESLPEPRAWRAA